MADVNRDRGQLILVTALGLAALFVALALVLNTAIYTENLATRSSEVAGGIDAVRYRDAAREGIGGTVEYVNHHNDTSYTALDSSLTAGVDVWTNASGRLRADSGAVANVSILDTTNGTRIVQTNGTRNFTNAGGDPAWTVADGVSNVRHFRLNVTSATFLGSEPSAFEMSVNGGWSMNVTQDASGNTVVGVDNGTEDFFCPTPNDEPWINITAGTVGGQSCEGLNFTRDAAQPYNISYDHADNINGTYELAIDVKRGSLPSLVANYGTRGTSPDARPYLYSVEIQVTYGTPRLYYDTSIRIAPGESDG